MSFHITFLRMENSEFVTAKAKEHAEKLMRIAPEMVACRVVIEAPTAHHHHGQPFHVRLQLEVPGKDIVVDRGTGHAPAAHEDVYVALHDAFDVARRRLEERNRIQREEVRRQDAGIF